MLTNSYEFLDRDVVDFINKTIASYPNFNEERFQLWIDMNDIETKNNPSAYVNKCFLKELKSGTFIKPEEPKEPIIEYLSLSAGELFNEMRAMGIKVSQASTCSIMDVCDYLINNKVLTITDLRELNHGIVRYIAENDMTSDEFIDLMKKSKVLRGKVKWEEVDKENQAFREECDSLLNSFYKIK